MKSSSVYLTTTLPYVNADPHIGFALEIVQADVIARWKRAEGFDVFLNTGTDEHGVKIYRKAQESGLDPQTYVDGFAEKFRALKEPLGLISDIHFIRTTDPHHLRAAQEFWRRCASAGDIYKKNYKVKYCVGCELEKTDSELVEGKCPVHPSLSLEVIEEENYFFRLSKYQTRLLQLYEETPDFLIPRFRLNEIHSLIKEKGLEDFSVSRLAKKMPWGVPVPEDADHVMYVWFDAFVNYISTIGWPEDEASFKKWWPVIQFAGKDQVRQQAVMWQAMLMSVGLPPSRRIFIHGFITSGGQKMSKSLGNVVDPLQIVKEFGTDALRYYLLRHIHPYEDSDFTIAHFKEMYNAGLANGLGNLVSRVLKMATANDVRFDGALMTDKQGIDFEELIENHKRAIMSYDFKTAADTIWEVISLTDGYIQEHKPFSLIKTDPSSAKRHIAVLLKRLMLISSMLEPFLPQTSATIQMLLRDNKMPETSLFPRKE